MRSVETFRQPPRDLTRPHESCPLLAAGYALQVWDSPSEHSAPTRLMLFNEKLALIVPILLLMLAVRKNSGIFAAILLLILFIVNL